jgi:hypothetical protein
MSQGEFALNFNSRYFKTWDFCMLVVILGISILAGIFSVGLILFFDQATEKKTRIEELIELESVILRSLIAHHEQINHMEDQQDRLREKKSSSVLIKRYEEDILLLEKRKEELAEDVQRIWKYRMLEEFQHGYMEMISSFPEVPTLAEAKREEFKAVILDLGEYMQGLKERASQLEKRSITVPAHMHESCVLEEVSVARREIVTQFMVLIEKSDALSDQLQYLCDALEVKRISEMVEEQREAEEVLEELSSYLERQALQFQEWNFDVQLTEKSSDVESLSSDIRARIVAEREVEEALRARIYSRNKKRSKTRI